MRRTACLLLPLVLAACGGPAALHSTSLPGAPAAPTTAIDVDAPAQVAPAAIDLPSSLSCVTDAVRGVGDRVPMVHRVFVTVEGATAQATVTRGPQFRMHAGRASTDAPGTSESRHEGLVVDGRGGITGDGLRLVVERDGLVLTGTVDVAGDTLGAVCWNDTEVFGSAWGGGGGVPARFDWATSTCLDAAGKPALNALPIELVRETAFAECADLSGVALNGDDLSQPDLAGWWLAGARLAGSELFFADLTSASLFGADLSAMTFGYATVSGTIDAATQLPADTMCETTESPWAGALTTCTR